jgi:hypothetical protein
MQTPQDVVKELEDLNKEYMEQFNGINQLVHDTSKNVFKKRKDIMEVHSILKTLKQKADGIKKDSMPIFNSASLEDQDKILKAANNVDATVNNFKSAVTKMILGG